MRKIKIICIIISLFTIGITLFCLFDGEGVNAEEIEKTSDKTIFVDIKGAVNNPGVYEMYNGDRVVDIIEKAGGLREDADTSIINLSKKLVDEMYIIIYTYEDIMNYKSDLIPSTKIIKEVEERIICPDSDNDACINKDSSIKDSSINGKININTGSLDDLKTLPGIGEAKANKIIEYRNEHAFENIEDIKNVTGIGTSVFEKIKDYIEV